MNLADVIYFAETTFNTKMGYAGKYADGHPGIFNIPGKVDQPRVGTKPYVTIMYGQRAPVHDLGAYGYYAEQWEHKLACEFINALDAIRGAMGRNNPQPDLYWRHLEKVSYYKDIDTGFMQMRARLYREGFGTIGAGPSGISEQIVGCENLPRAKFCTTPLHRNTELKDEHTEPDRRTVTVPIEIGARSFGPHCESPASSRGCGTWLRRSINTGC